jgi:hypothetical protein
MMKETMLNITKSWVILTQIVNFFLGKQLESRVMQIRRLQRKNLSLSMQGMNTTRIQQFLLKNLGALRRGTPHLPQVDIVESSLALI